VYGTKGHVPDFMVKGDSTYWFITDHLGSVRLLVNVETGHITQRLDYDEFGNVLVNTNEGFQPFGYAGGAFDEQTGLVRFGARDYDAGMGRWTAKDPVGFSSGQLNFYGYVLNDPINLIDNNGKYPWVWMLKELTINLGMLLSEIRSIKFWEDIKTTIKQMRKSIKDDLSNCIIQCRKIAADNSCFNVFQCIDDCYRDYYARLERYVYPLEDLLMNPPFLTRIYYMWDYYKTERGLTIK